MYWWMILDSMDNFDWDDYRHQVMQVAVFWAKNEKDAKAMAKKWGFHEFDMSGRYKTIKDAKKAWKDNQRGNKPHKYNEIDFAVKNGKMKKANIMDEFDKGIDESYKVHYPSLKKLTQLRYTDPRVNTDGKTIHAEREGHFGKGDDAIHGHYVVYEDSGMPGSFIGVHIGSELSEDGGDAPVNVVAIDKSRSAVINRVSYRARQCKVHEGVILDEGIGDIIDKAEEIFKNLFTNKKETDAANEKEFKRFDAEMDKFLAAKLPKKYSKDRKKIERFVRQFKSELKSKNYADAKMYAGQIKKVFNKMPNMKSLGTEVGPDGKPVSDVWEVEKPVNAQDPRWGLVDEATYSKYDGEYTGPEFEGAWGNLKKGKTYLAVEIPYEGHSFYEVPSGTKMKDFKKGGKYREWVERNDLDDYDTIDFIMKLIDT